MHSKMVNMEKCMTCFLHNQIEVTFYIGKDVDIMMTKQALLENVLDIWLTQKQIDAIENGWNAFYNNPMQYKNSVVVDMVKLFLQEV